MSLPVLGGYRIHTKYEKLHSSTVKILIDGEVSALTLLVVCIMVIPDQKLDRRRVKSICFYYEDKTFEESSRLQIAYKTSSLKMKLG